MNKKGILDHSAWWTLLPFSILSLLNKAWVRNDTLATIAWAFFFLWSLTECIKEKGTRKESFIIQTILSSIVFIVLVWNIINLIQG